MVLVKHKSSGSPDRDNQLPISRHLHTHFLLREEAQVRGFPMEGAAWGNCSMK